MLRKVLICPYFGPFPEWMDLFLSDFARTMRPQGYELLLDTDLESFKERVRAKLGIEYPGVRGVPKVWDYRCTLGLLYEEEIKEFDYWGFCDFDVVWGDVTNKLIPDHQLKELAVFSGHDEYICGCFSLFKNTMVVNTLFKEFYDWKTKMIDPIPNGWIEKEFSTTLEYSKLPYTYSFNQGDPWNKNPNITKRNGLLYQDGVEIAFFHFRHSKHLGWPIK